jgi:CO/xanthine dehydrogenase Mo-binding subunit
MHVVGRPAPGAGLPEIVTGRARYVGDLTRAPDALVGRLLYAAHPCARIARLDASRALALPGVVAVLTADDVPGENSFLYSDLADRPLLVADRARCQGDIVAAVAAETEAEAEAALAAIEVDYEVLPGVFDAVAAMQPGAPQVWPDRGNVCDHLVVSRGDIEAGFAQADLIIENIYTTPRNEHAFLEPEGALALVEPDGTVAVYASCQAPFRDREQIARALALPEDRVRVIVPFVGGAFGGKDEAHVQIHAALLAQATGRPVRIVRSREESIRTHVKRHPVTVRYRSGVARDGRLTAVDVTVIGDTGPYVTAGAEVMSLAATTAGGPYDIPNARLEAYTVLTNNPLCGAMRGFGIPQTAFARERQMDELARALGMDPLEIRLRNALTTGTQLPTGARIREGRPAAACLQRAAELSGWAARSERERAPAPHLRRGWGMAATLFTVGLGRNVSDQAAAALEMAPDGSVLLRTGASEMGQGIHTALAQLAAEALGVELSAVRLLGPDTARAPDAGAAVGSRQVYVSGNAVLDAARPIRESLLEAASEQTGLPRAVLSLRGGVLYAEDERISVTTVNLAARAAAQGLPLHGEGFYAMQYSPDFPADGYPYAHEVFTFGAQVAQVLVDIETGQVRVEKLTIVQDAGQVVNPQGARGQIEGGAIMGLGYALLEEWRVEDGRSLNDSLASYLIPTVLDAPEMAVEILEIPEPGAPFGAKGIGEATVTPVAPAVANAVADAVGIAVRGLPMAPEAVLAAIDGVERPSEAGGTAGGKPAGYRAAPDQSGWARGGMICETRHS